MSEKNFQSISDLLIDDYQLLQKYVEGKKIKKVAQCTESLITLLMEDGVLLKIFFLEDELMFDICLS